MGRRPEVNGRELVLEAALDLFAREGPDAVSIRAINRQAGLGPASVHYHFGTKDALIDAIIERHSPTVVAEILDRAQALERRPEVAPRDVIEAFAIPYWTLLATNPEGWKWIRVMGWLMSTQPDRVRSPVVDTLVNQNARRCFPDSSEQEVAETLRMAFQLLIAHLTVRTPGRRRGAPEEDEPFTRLLAFLSGGLREALGSSVPAPR